MLSDESLYATELAEYLVYEGVAFSDAHTIVGRLIRYSQDKGFLIKEMSDAKLRSFHQKLSLKAVKRIMNPQYALSSKNPQKKVRKK